MASYYLIVFDFVALVAVFLVYSSFESRRRRKGLAYPPGPRPLPVVGNLFDIPSEYSWLTYAEWAKTYGDVISLTVLGQVIVVLNSPTAARDLLDKRSAFYSERPKVPFYDLMEWGWFVPTSRYDDVWRAGRKVLDRGLRPNVAVQYQPMQKAKVHNLLKNLASQPEKFKEHTEHFQGSIIMASVYGYDVQEHADRYLGVACEMSLLGSRTVLPGALLVNDLPFLKYFPEWLPGMGFKSLARYGRRLGEEVVDAPFQFVKNGMRDGSARPSMTLFNLQDLDDIDSPESQETLRLIAGTSGSLHAAGADTVRGPSFVRNRVLFVLTPHLIFPQTVSAMLSFLLMLVLYPEVQRKAQAELDAVTGAARLPDFSDRPRLPYIDAVCKELLRWRVITALGVPHAALQDDVYKGYFIPKGKYSECRAMLHDPNVYPDPETFRPERFLTEDGQVKDDPTLSAVFGFGKRICPGRHLVDSTLFIFVTSVLSVFTLGKAKDAQGHEIPVDSVSTGALVSHPAPFKCSITLRDKKAEKLVSGLQGE
ncbi:cytochrome P450 [Artomyces pyxidatus]|uniref:Cytochrome P450 n=1 Tax=Artomyces pyxidatus TaxID=48021 RepID=A0ACB8SL33_9AGAM|nr:cytochrome P450 [Artomyces pyxidatus]